jgi:hypothetical protein
MAPPLTHIDCTGQHEIERKWECNSASGKAIGGTKLVLALAHYNTE